MKIGYLKVKKEFNTTHKRLNVAAQLHRRKISCK
jgi:hypothetical protein